MLVNWNSISKIIEKIPKIPKKVCEGKQYASRGRFSNFAQNGILPYIEPTSNRTRKVIELVFSLWTKYKTINKQFGTLWTTLQFWHILLVCRKKRLCGYWSNLENKKVFNSLIKMLPKNNLRNMCPAQSTLCTLVSS